MFLFICMTNLQLLIARSIIEKEQLNSVDFYLSEMWVT
ncbi:2-glucosyltransferase [Salmonella enterica subsp. arizonae]|nr:2-glucosyltransferase [Salmonella enterica subsp. arizonae]